MDQKKVGLILAVFAVFALCLMPRISYAANLNLATSLKTIDVGKTANVTVYVSSPDQAINAVSGVVSFPQDKIEVVSLSKKALVNFWVQEPSYSNSQGAVSFEGVVLNPGFKGSQGSIITITFKAKAPGTASIRLSSGSVLANDGKGTSVLQNLGSTSFVIEELPAPVEPEPKPAEVTKEPEKPLKQIEDVEVKKSEPEVKETTVENIESTIFLPNAGACDITPAMGFNNSNLINDAQCQQTKTNWIAKLKNSVFGSLPEALIIGFTLIGFIATLLFAIKKGLSIVYSRGYRQGAMSVNKNIYLHGQRLNKKNLWDKWLLADSCVYHPHKPKPKGLIVKKTSPNKGVVVKKSRVYNAKKFD